VNAVERIIRLLAAAAMIAVTLAAAVVQNVVPR
jgi:hypothetical protein